MSEPALSSTSAAATARQQARFLDLVGEKLEATEAVFRRHLDSDVPFIADAGTYIAAGGGKRMRPALLLLTARLLGHDGEEEVTYAAVVEFIHNATLIHDDIIDHAALRRGRRTLNELWGNSRTVLLGDWIYLSAMRLALRHGNLAVVERLCDATLRMTEGELLALERLGAPDLGVAEYFEIIDRKTAHLFAAACGIPTLMKPIRPGAREALESYGRALGTCFQIVDDLLDLTGAQDELGKPVLSDLKEGKLTLPLILVRERLAPERRRAIDWVLEDRSFKRVPAEEIVALVRAEGGVEQAEAIAHQHAAAAREALAGLPAGPARDALEFAPDYVLRRRS